MSSLKFDEFFYDGALVNLQDALDADLTDLRDIYDKDRLYCPECRAARLKFTRKTNSRSAFLSTKQPSANNPNNHLNNCSHSFEKGTKRQVKEYYSLLTDEQIEDKLNAAINLYLHNANGDAANNLPPLEHNPGIASAIENGRRVHRRLPRRSFYSIYNITDDELGVPLLLYGRVQLVCTEHPSRYREGETYYRLQIISTRTGNTIRRFNVAYLPEAIHPNTEYFLTMIVIASREWNNKLKYDIYRRDPLSIRYIPVR